MPITRRAGVLAVATGLALLTAACGGTSSGGTSSAASASAGTGGASSAYVSDKLSFARCLRAHGVPNYPDPGVSGQEPAGAKQLISTPRGQAAVGACGYWGSRVHNDAAGQNQVQLAEYVRFAQCMRSHGLMGFPDPVYSSSERRVEFMLSASQDGFDPHSPQVLAKAHQCESVLPAGSGLPHVQVTS